MPAENILQTLQRIATLVRRVEEIAEDQRELKATVTLRLERMDSQIGDLRDRLTRIEATRDADKAELRAEVARFKAEVERAEARLSRLPPPRDSD